MTSLSNLCPCLGGGQIPSLNYSCTEKQPPHAIPPSQAHLARCGTGQQSCQTEASQTFLNETLVPLECQVLSRGCSPSS